MNADSFLADVEDFRPLPSLGDAGSLEALRLAIGPATRGLEIAVPRAAHKPTQAATRAAWAFRHGGRAAPVLLTVLYGDRAAPLVKRRPCSKTLTSAKSSESAARTRTRKRGRGSFCKKTPVPIPSGTVFDSCGLAAWG
jgi:hypothetical protein